MSTIAREVQNKAVFTLYMKKIREKFFSKKSQKSRKLNVAISHKTNCRRNKKLRKTQVLIATINSRYIVILRVFFF